MRDMEDRIMVITQSEQQTERQIKENESSIWDLWDNIKHANLCIIRIPEGEERKKGIENIFEEIKAENFTNLKKEIDIQIQEVQRFQTRWIQTDLLQDISLLKWQKLKIKRGF